jgi:hypothetical protein
VDVRLLLDGGYDVAAVAPEDVIVLLIIWSQSYDHELRQRCKNSQRN